ncbi:ATP-binding cassette domain-containing protein [Rhodoferax sp. TBRC 17198]|uniref:ATP-binding cassette domain-containing protein n=1 Tax=Rhodoferax potami TaxID=3068338 RepID=UPI0028BD1CAD|nr:ATP-binding cassette domain-containing protein [Rhodoferax sp. TBRC 17198]MDT7524403.1 ATP-binding cassette domain-containing protein [Rhodoferax sp. TBRC 17198]
MRVEEMPRELLPTLLRLCYLMQVEVDAVALTEVVSKSFTDQTMRDPTSLLSAIGNGMGYGSIRLIQKPDQTLAPLLVRLNDGRWGILRGRNSIGHWIVECLDLQSNNWTLNSYSDEKSFKSFLFEKISKIDKPKSSVFRLVCEKLKENKKSVVSLLIAGLTINVLVIATSLYSMHVYDRVVPTGASSTLLVLTIGVCASIILELIVRHVRSNLFTELASDIDSALAKDVYNRFLSLRLDQLPQSVGGLASQLRGYESVRTFFTGTSSQLLTDLPFILVFAISILIIGGKLVFIPLTFLIISLVLGVLSSNESTRMALIGYQATNQKMGLLVETVEGAETIKAGQGGWRMLSRWLKVTADSQKSEFSIKKSTEWYQHVASTFHQLSYVLIIAAGALVVGQGDLTQGGLIAVSILSGRLLSCIALIPGFISQLNQTRVAIQGIDKLWSMKDDHDGLPQPVVLQGIAGKYKLSSVEFAYGGKPVLNIPNLQISSGSKVGVIGPIGAGKTSLIRLLSGMYKPQFGKVLLDDIDISILSKPVLSMHTAFVAQDARLFAGTLKDNLILGIIDPGDQFIYEVAKKTGLYDSVLMTHEKGLYQEVYEGGTGLSIGQRQLVHFTRAFMRNRSVWLLDEPTASMDSESEKRAIEALKSTIKKEDTLIVISHKLDLLLLVDRLIVIVKNQIVLDGERDLVLRHLKDQHVNI